MRYCWRRKQNGLVNQNDNDSTLNQLTMYLNYENKSDKIVTVTTNDAQFFCQEKHTDSWIWAQQNVILEKIKIRCWTKIGLRSG